MSKQQPQREKKDDVKPVGNAPETDRPERRSRKRQLRLEASVNMDELRELIALIQENGFTEFEVQREGFRFYVRRHTEAGERNEAGTSSQSQSKPTSAATQARSSQEVAKSGAAAKHAHPGAQAETAASEDQDLQMVPSPIVGTFYRSASPNADPFVKIGSRVEADTVVCIIEAMKLMNEIQAETSGDVVKIYVENGQPVEYGQPLFGIKN
jgi:acetyl-CoA carboxylase biotin carboxyl carrier protein